MSKELVPKTVTVNGSFKAYGLVDGISSGSDVGVTLDVPEGLTRKELDQKVLEWELWANRHALAAEMLKGFVSKETGQVFMQKLVGNFEKGLEKLKGTNENETAE